MVMKTNEMNDVLDAIDAGPIEVIRGDVEGAMREIGVDPESGLKVCVELEDSRGEVWRVYARTEELSGLAGTLVGEGGVVVGSKVAVVVSKALELDRELRAKDLVRIEFVVVTEGDAGGDEGDERLVVWVNERSHLRLALVELIAGVLKKKKEEEPMAPMETDGPMAPMAPMETEVAMETGVPKTQETEVPKKMDTGVPKDAQETEVATAPMETEPMAPMETKVPKKKEPEGPKPQEPMETKVAIAQETKAEKAALLRAKAAEAAEAAERAAREAEEAEAAAEEEAAAERESEREQTKEALKRARETLERVREEVEGLERELKQQNDVERRKRKRMNQGESPRRRVWARKEEMEKEKEEIVMVDDREFERAMGAHGGAVHRVWVGRFEPSGPGGIGPVRGGEMVLESVYCSGGAELFAMLATCTGTDGEVVVKGFKAVKEFDAWMEENEFVKRTIDVESRCMNPGSPAEPEYGDDTERVWVKRGSAELAALDKLIAKARARSRKWQCPESPRSPAYRPVSPVYAYAPRSPVEDDDDDHDETSCVD
jgi:hypothetical protein